MTIAAAPLPLRHPASALFEFQSSVMESRSNPRVKATLRLGSESYAVEGDTCKCLSDELVSMKAKSMSILKDYITRHNVPIDVPDEPLEEEEEEEEEGEGESDEDESQSFPSKTKQPI